MKQRAAMFNDAISDFDRTRINNEAYQAAYELAGAVSKSGLSREMEKLRLIKRYEFFRDGKPNEACARSEEEAAAKAATHTEPKLGGAPKRSKRFAEEKVK